MMTGCTHVPEPTSLKDALDFAGAMRHNSGGLKDLVGKELERRVEDALGLPTAPKSVADKSSIKDNFNEVLDNLKELRTLIVDDSQHGFYGSYESLKQSPHDASCVELCVKHILGVLPELYCTLNYFHFKVDSSNGGLGGGGWRGDKCNGYVSSATGTLGAWLKDSNTAPNGLHSASGSDVKILPGGYKTGANLKSTEGSALESHLQKLVSDSGSSTGSCLHYLLLDMAVITKYSHCLVPTCLVIMRALCEGGQKKFQAKLTQDSGLEDILKTLRDTLKPFAPEQSEGSQALLTALFKGSPHVYSKRLTNTVAKHLEWLTPKLPLLTASLNTLKGDSTKWEQTDLQEAKTSGLFGYGFSFGGKWKSNWDDNCKNQISAAITKLTEDLSKLKSILKQHLNGSGSSAGSIAGSLLGTAAVGGAGAAVSFNAIDAAAKKLPEGGSEGVHVSQALKNLKSEITLKGIIEKLAGGLGDFIGYNGEGQGIALVIDPLQQLRKGVLMFLQMMLDRFRDSIDKDSGIFTAVGNAIKNTEKFESAMKEVSKLEEKGDQSKNVVCALKNATNLNDKNGVTKLAEAFKKYLEEVLGAVRKVSGINGQAQSQVDTLKSNLGHLLDKFGERSDFSTSKDQVNEAARQLKSAGLGHPARTVIEGVTKGIDNMLIPLQKKDGYKSSYLSTSNWDGDHDNDKIAQIFLGCLPLYYYWLTYLYWKCKQPYDRGGWEGQWLNSGSLSAFISGQGYAREYFKNQAGKQIATLLERFDELKDSMQTASGTPSTTTKPSHTDLLTELNKSLQEAIGTGSSSTANLNGHSLSALFQLSRCYFTGKQIINPATERRPPTSIREMLYWLSGLQFSPHYYDLQKQIGNHIPDKGLHVADSGIPASTANSSGDTLTRDQIKGFLLSSCLSAPGVLGAIQGNTADSKDEPWLHSLFCNSMNLQYPSGSALFNTLSNYAYALQFQLHFLYRQCQNNYTYTCGWNQCAFGANVNASIQDSIVASYICPTGCTKGSHSHSTRPDQCEHTGCGEFSKASPLQAFLTDNLNGFCRKHPGSSKHLVECSLGSMCHVPMGFKPTHLKSHSLGEQIFYPLLFFCSSPSTPLRQLCEKLSCLTKRTPRNLGDLFGFMWHLNGQLFKNERPTLKAIIDKFGKAFSLDSLLTTFENNAYSAITELWIMAAQKSQPSTPTVLSRSLKAMAPAIPFLYQLFMAKDEDSLPLVLFDLYQQCHKVEVRAGNRQGNTTIVTHNANTGHKCSTSPADLFSLQNSQCSGTNCGPYFYPLNHTNGSAFAPMHASSYLSWVLYLVDDLETELRGLLDEFRNVECPSNSLSTHDPSGNCSCPSVVHCGGTLPLLYANGFTFANAYSLKGGMKGNDSTKRNCQQFHKQLTVVLAPNESTPLYKLLLTIDEFLYMFRVYFFYNLSSFWIIYVCIVLYIYFLRADLLHLKSHVHFPSSHGIPSIGLLTSGNAPALTKLTKLTYFMP
ncbi:extracellular matrix-binding ebh [Babesia caballi]|uniref:Extracellular matrix-binding ebh n=1 Tax=Babesia caballi TaxID=5871 RepID=A0AAV4LQS3_BABCB|nr:extracellular matrix-binding ebh [Babesia caballi]